MGLSSDLLEQAARLAKGKKGRPKEADLRRSISASYYAMFHFLIEDVVGTVLGKGASKRELCHLVSRSFDHGKMKSFCLELNKKPAQNQKLLAPHLLRIGSTALKDAASFGAAFADLQEHRHKADYDLTFTVSKNQALALHTKAIDAIKDWKSFKTSQPDAHFFLCGVLMVWASLAGRS